MQTFELFNWIVIGQTKQLILSAYQDQAEFSWTDQKTASSPHRLYIVDSQSINPNSGAFWILQNNCQKNKIVGFLKVLYAW